MSIQKGKARKYSLIDQSPDGRAVSEYTSFKVTRSDATDAAAAANFQSKYIDFLALRKGHHVFGLILRVTPVDDDEFTATVKGYTWKVGLGNNTPGNVTGLVTSSNADIDAAPAAPPSFTLAAAENGLWLPIGKFVTTPATLSIQTVTGLAFNDSTTALSKGLTVEAAVQIGLSHE